VQRQDAGAAGGRPQQRTHVLHTEEFNVINCQELSNEHECFDCVSIFLET
jgi:hypothetical protein